MTRRIANRSCLAFSTLFSIAVASACSSTASELPDATAQAATVVGTTSVRLRTQVTGNYLMAHDGGGTTVDATSTNPSTWETFTLEDATHASPMSGDTVFLKTANGHYLSAVDGGGAGTTAQYSSPSTWETFTIAKPSGSGAIANGDSVTFRSTVSPHYLSATNGGGGPVDVVRTAASSWETFVVSVVGPAAGGSPTGTVADAGSSPASTATPAANTSPRVWGAANSWFLHVERNPDQTAILDAMQAANMKVVRLFVREFKQSGYVDYVSNVNNDTVSDVETANGFDDTVLTKIDSLMVQLKARGMKLVISLHDRWYLGDWEGSDIYATKYGVKAGTQALTDFYDVTKDANVMKQYDARLTHILTHRNALMGNRTWGEMNDVVFAVEAENEGMGHLSVSNAFAGAWECARAKVMKPYVSNGVLIATGGVTNTQDSTFSSFFECPEIDVVGVHNYDTGSFPKANVTTAVSVAKKNGKRLFIEEFGCTPTSGSTNQQKMQSRSDCNEQQHIELYESLGIPWMYWSVVKPTDLSREVFTDDPSWAMFEKHTAEAPKTGFAWPEAP